MNVYSVRLIPHLKIKFCEFFGIASNLAMVELGERLRRIDQKMDRFDAQLRRIHRRQMALEAVHAQAIQGQKKKQSQLASIEAKPKKKRLKAEKKKSPKRLAKVPALSLAQKSKPLSPQALPVDKSPTVLMLQTGAEVQKVVEDFFGAGVEVISLNDFEALPNDIEEREILSVFFERNLLGNDEARAALKEMQVHMPKTRFVGLSNYLTLALARATDSEADFATFLTQPIAASDLETVFSSQVRGQSAIGGKD